MEQLKSRPRILAIDDVPTNLVVLASTLAADFDFQLAVSGAAGLALAEEQAPDLVLIDLMMPEMDGYETCRRFKELPGMQNVPVIFITALSDLDSERRCLMLGAADFISKPFRVEVVRQRISNLLERENLRRELEISRDLLEKRVAERTAELEQSMLSLRIARDAAEVASRAKSTFIANVGHELRTPMNAIIGLSMLLQRSSVDEQQKEKLGHVLVAARRLMLHLNHLIDLAALESEKLRLESQSFALGDLLRELDELFADVAQAKGLALTVSLPLELAGELVIGDPMRIKAVLADLIGNAIKFTEHGFVRCTLSGAEETPAHHLLHFRVEDSGIGIDPADFHRIFQPFEQLEAGSTRRFGGTGLGLNICRRLAELMGGRIVVSSVPGHGSCFEFTLALAKAPVG